MICITFDTDHMTNNTLDKFIKMYLNEIPGACTFFIHKIFLNYLIKVAKYALIHSLII